MLLAISPSLLAFVQLVGLLVIGYLGWVLVMLARQPVLLPPGQRTQAGQRKQPPQRTPPPPQAGHATEAAPQRQRCRG